MMIKIKNKRALEAIRGAGKRIAQVLHDVAQVVVAGASTLDIDQWVMLELKRHSLVSQTKGYRGYQHVTCVSVNDELVHGVPRKEKILKSGDLVTVDLCAAWNGYCADSARCFIVGGAPEKKIEQAQKLIDVAWSSLNRAIEKVVVGGRLTDISSAVQEEVEKNGFGVVRDFCGHGIGKTMHEEPEILNYGQPGSGPVLRSGMVFAIEPMITQGDYKIKIASDGWTASTLDGSLAAHVEDTVIITDVGPEVVTRL